MCIFRLRDFLPIGVISIQVNVEVQPDASLIHHVREVDMVFSHCVLACSWVSTPSTQNQKPRGHPLAHAGGNCWVGEEGYLPLGGMTLWPPTSRLMRVSWRLFNISLPSCSCANLLKLNIFGEFVSDKMGIVTILASDLFLNFQWLLWLPSRKKV